MYPFRRTCKEAASLMVAEQDRALGWQDRVGLRMHLGICQGCVNFGQQMRVIRQAMARWRHYQEPDPPQTDQKK